MTSPADAEAMTTVRRATVFAGWKQTAAWLRRVEPLRDAA
jgi:hypothetical protein